MIVGKEKNEGKKKEVECFKEPNPSKKPRNIFSEIGNISTMDLNCSLENSVAKSLPNDQDKNEDEENAIPALTQGLKCGIVDQEALLYARDQQIAFAGLQVQLARLEAYKAKRS